MNKQKPTFLMLLAAFIFMPTLFSWSTAADGAWYRPFFIWLAVILIAFYLLNRKTPQ